MANFGWGFQYGADFGGRLNIEADFGGRFQYAGGFRGRVLVIETDFGGDCFIRPLLKGCWGHFWVLGADLHIEVDFGGVFQSGGGFRGRV
jgi:hypothetical protein